MQWKSALSVFRYLPLKMAKAKCHKCEEKCGAGKVHPDILEKLDKGFKNFYKSNSKSLLKKYLTRDVFDQLKTRKTSFGSSLLDCVQSGFANLDSNVGIYASDPEAYAVFGPIFDPIIQDYHLGFKKSDVQPPTDFGAIDKLGDVDPKCEFVVSTRIRVGRTLEGFPYNPRLTENQYKEIEMKVKTILCDLTEPLKGNYYPLCEMTPEEQKDLIDNHFLFKDCDKYLQAANACQFWPIGRGIFFNYDKTFLVWINEEDHIRIISLQPGGNVGEVFRRLVCGITEIEKKLCFARNDRLGNVTFCPTNLGTGIRASVHIRLPKLSSNMTRLNDLAAKYNLQVRGTKGEHSDAEDGIYDISNLRRLGLTEADIIKEMFDGITELIKQEKG